MIFAVVQKGELMRAIDADELKKKAFGKRGGLIHTADINAMPTIEERKTGKWIGIKEYCDHLNEEAEREGKGNRYMPSGMNIHVYCNQCWEPNDRRTTYCPHCGARLVQEGEDNGQTD